MGNLKYKKLNNANNVLLIDLNNGYSIIAIHGFSQELNTFSVTLYLKDNQFTTLRMIGFAEKLIFKDTYKTINNSISKAVGEMFEAGMFDEYIKQYEFEEGLVSSGIEALEVKYVRFM